MALILAYLILFMIGMQLLDAAGLFRLIGNETVCSVLKGLLEMKRQLGREKDWKDIRLIEDSLARK